MSFFRLLPEVRSSAPRPRRHRARCGDTGLSMDDRESGGGEADDGASGSSCRGVESARMLVWLSAKVRDADGRRSVRSRARSPTDHGALERPRGRGRRSGQAPRPAVARAEERDASASRSTGRRLPRTAGRCWMPSKPYSQRNATASSTRPRTDSSTRNSNPSTSCRVWAAECMGGASCGGFGRTRGPDSLSASRSRCWATTAEHSLSATQVPIRQR